MTKYNYKKPLTLEEVSNLKDGSLVQAESLRNIKAICHMHIGTLSSFKGFYNVDFIPSYKKPQSYQFTFENSDIGVIINLYKLINEPLHKLIEGMRLDSAVSMLKKQVGNELCIHCKDLSPLSSEDKLNMFSPNIVKDVLQINGDIVFEMYQPEAVVNNSRGYNYSMRLREANEVGLSYYIYEGLYQEQEPKNNDGRSTCYWCGSPTKQVPSITSFYTICSKCGK